MKKHINKDFFKIWTDEMSYVLGYIVADGCIIKRANREKSYILNITSVDHDHLRKINKAMDSDYAIGAKANSTGKICYQISVTNREICESLLELGVIPKKTNRNISIIVPEEFSASYIRGFFDGDGSVYIYNVNGTSQIKASLAGNNKGLIEYFNHSICYNIDIPLKRIQERKPVGNRKKGYAVTFYIDDCEKLAKFMYSDNTELHLERKFKIFEKWKDIKRRDYRKKNYPSKVGWYLREGAVSSAG